MFAVDMVPVVVVVVVLPVAAFDLASAAFCASRAAFRLGLAPIITLKNDLELRKIFDFFSYLHTLLLNEGIPRAYQGKKLHLKNILFFPSKSEGITCRF